MGSSDPVVTMLKDFRYNTVRLPRTNIRPLQVLKKENNDLTLMGDLSDLLVAAHVPLPTTTTDQAGFINGQRTRDLKIGVGLTILGGIIGAMGGSKLGLETKYSSAKTATFEFDNVEHDGISQINLIKYLSAADIAPGTNAAAQLLESDQLYIISDTIKSKKFTFEGKKEGGVGVQIDVPVIKGIVGGSVGVTTAGSSQSKVTYEGAVPLIFGFQAVRIFFEHGVFTTVKNLKIDEGALRGIDEEGDTSPTVILPEEGDKFETEPLQVESPFVNLKM